MPVFVRKKGKKYKVMHGPKSSPKIVKNKSGTAVDGGGHTTRMAAQAQARAINAT